jgi:hypothetical protein
MHSVFDSILIRKQSLLDAPVDLGFLAQAMVFYRRVHIIAEPGVLDYLLKICGPDSLKVAIEEGFLELSYFEGLLGIQTDTDHRGVQRHYPGLVGTLNWPLSTAAKIQCSEPPVAVGIAGESPTA